MKAAITQNLNRPRLVFMIRPLSFCYDFSKKLENLHAAVALHFVQYNRDQTPSRSLVVPKVKVYRAQRYHPESDSIRVSTRMYTREAIAASKLLTLIDGTEAEIDSEELVPGEGWTPENFTPKSSD